VRGIFDPFNFFVELDPEPTSAAGSVIYFDTAGAEEFKFYGESRKLKKIKRELDTGARTRVNDTVLSKSL